MNEVRQAKDKDELSGRIDAAITKMPEEFQIKGFLEAHRAEVKGMLLTEYDEVTTMELFKEEGRVEGRAEGENRLGMLISEFLSRGRTEDAERAATDKAYRNQLYKEFKMA